MTSHTATAARRAVEPFRAMALVAEAEQMAAKGDDIVMLCIGQPAAPAPLAVREAAAKAVENGRIGYTASAGMMVLRKRIARYYGEHYDVDLDPRRVIVTTGSSGAFMLTFLTLFDPGAKVAIPAPGYPAYRNILNALAVEPVELATGPASRWALTDKMLAEAHGETPLDGVLVTNPNNPNGTMMMPDALRAVIDRAESLGVSVISDEIYHGLTYDMPEMTALSHTDKAVIINSFSKYFCMSGWRLGWLVAPPHLVEPIERLQQSLFICPPQISQLAALAVFDARAELDAVKQGYLENRDFLLGELPRLGFRSIQPVDGAFYAYADVSGLSNDSERFCREALLHAKTAITPGTDFDTKRGRAWVRFSFAGSKEELARGVERLETFIGSRAS